MVGAAQFSAAWWLRNTGVAGAPSFEEEVLAVERTIPGEVDQLTGSSYRLYFAIPVLPAKTRVYFYETVSDSTAAARLICASTAPSCDVIFIDGFESGDTTAWSETQP